MPCILKTSTANWNKLDDAQYQALRIAIGCMGFAPIRALLSETGKVPLRIRRTLLAAKPVTKLLSKIDDRITNQLIIIYIYTIFAENPCYWRNTSIPAMVEGIDLTIYYYNDIYRANKLPCFGFPDHLQALKLNFTKLNLTKDTHNERLFINKIKQVASDYKLVFTDAPVEPANLTCGIGIYGEDLNISVSRKLTRYTAISSTETLAIRQAVKISKNKTHKVEVISDSLSALQAIIKQGVDKEQDYITLSTRKEMVKASQKGDCKVHMGPSHTGITDNEHADKLALAGKNQNLVYQNNLVPGRSFLALIKNKLCNQWISNYKNGYQNKGQHYVDIQPTPSKIPCFYNIRYNNQAMISLMIRMRTNHCCTPTYLHKIGMKEDYLYDND
nr:unnamed protein product [Callosobruchus analis]